MKAHLARTQPSKAIQAIVEPAALASAWRRVRKKAKGGAAGGDGIDVRQFGRNLDAELGRLHAVVLAGRYRPGPLRAHAIPKDDGSARVLRIPSVRDRVLQTATAEYLAGRFDPTMGPNSFAYRRRLSVKHAVGRMITYRLWGYQTVLDADIEGSFDNVSRHHPKHRLGTLRTDSDFQALIESWLHGFSKGGFSRDGRGIAQGSPISPVLANLYLDPLHRALNVKGRHMVRFADDFVVLTKSRAGAAKAARRCEAVLTELNLVLNRAKNPDH